MPGRRLNTGRGRRRRARRGTGALAALCRQIRGQRSPGPPSLQRISAIDATIQDNLCNRPAQNEGLLPFCLFSQKYFAKLARRSWKTTDQKRAVRWHWKSSSPKPVRITATGPLPVWPGNLFSGPFSGLSGVPALTKNSKRLGLATFSRTVVQDPGRLDSGRAKEAGS